MKGKYFLFFCLLALNVTAQNNGDSKMKKLIDDDFQFAASQYKLLANSLPADKNMPDDRVPYWDYDAAPGTTTLRDASAAAVMASALLELSRYSKKDQQEYKAVAEKQIQSLSSDVYRSKAGGNGGFILQHSVGSLPDNCEIDVPLTYADYYFLEALKRYNDWYL